MRPNPKETAELVTFTEEILNGKLHFLWNDIYGRILTTPASALRFCVKVFFLIVFQICLLLDVWWNSKSGVTKPISQRIIL